MAILFENLVQAWTYSPNTLWNNPITRSVSSAAAFVYQNVQPLVDRISHLTNAEFFANVSGISTVNRFAVMPTLRLNYYFLKRLLDTTALPRSFEGVDAFSKFITTASGLAQFQLEGKHPLIVACKKAATAFNGIIVTKHLVDLIYAQKYKEIIDEAKTCGTIAMLLFQSSHFCQFHEYLKSNGIFDLIGQTKAAQTIGRIPVIGVCLGKFPSLPLGKAKDALVVLGSIFTLAAIVEQIGLKYRKYAALPEVNGVRRQAILEEFLATEVTDRDEDKWYGNLFNSFTKALVVATIAAWIPKYETIFTVFSNVLGLTNAHKEMGAILGKDEEAEDAGKRLTKFYLAGKRNDPVGNYRINVLSREGLAQRACFRG